MLQDIVDEYNKVSKIPTKYYKHICEQSKKYSYKFNTATSNTNIEKNRYHDILANDDYRFKSNNIDYINADVFVSDISGKQYIMTQGPIRKYIYDFLSMVIESRSEIIVCLTKSVENRVVKFDPYFVDDFETVYFSDSYENSEQFYTVSVVNKFHDKNIIVRYLSITKKNVNGVIDNRVVTHLHYIGWPDRSVPSDTVEYLKLYEYIHNTSTPIIVHCSAGIGRTGTFVVVNELIESIKRNIPINVINKIIELRKFRSSLVQNCQQMLMCYKCIINYFYLQTNQDLI